jgi:hypothetical protein
MIGRATRKPRHGVGARGERVVPPIGSTSIPLNKPSAGWSRFSAGVRGAKAHVVYDPESDCPLYISASPRRGWPGAGATRSRPQCGRFG